MTIANSLYLTASRALVRSRETELFISKHYSDANLRCPVHLAIGHEAVPASLLSVHSQNRYIFSYHRSHHHYLSSGASISSLILEIGGHPLGCSSGHGGSHHLHNPESGYMGSTPIIAGTLPVATGYAHGKKMSDSKARIFCFMGDSIGEEGLFTECLNTASLYSLPITFVIEDNQLSCFTPSSQRQGFQSYEQYANTFSIPYISMNGSSLLSCLEASLLHQSMTEQEQGPCLIHADVFRPYEHCGYLIEDQVNYRDITNSWPSRDPLFHIESEAINLGILETEFSSYVNQEKYNTRRECEDSYNEVKAFVKEFLT